MLDAVWERTSETVLEQVVMGIHDQGLAKEGA